MKTKVPTLVWIKCDKQCCRTGQPEPDYRLVKALVIGVLNTNFEQEFECEVIQKIQRRPNVFDVGPTLYKI